ncbi:MAG: T9SS type A sorting domain-containing protein [Saprospiraceae bacterium]|nr:T9SS type A sorting domain-containing protein [Saprospiraceae bacterium]
MNKINLLTSAIKYFGLLFILSFGIKSFSQCIIQATAYPNVICAGDSITLSATGSCGYLMKNDFNNGTIGIGWSSTLANPVFTNPCGPGPIGIHVWIGTTASLQRTLETANYNVSTGNCVINWDMRYGRDQNLGNCEDPDAANEGVHLQYSVNNGLTWTDFPEPNVNPIGPNSSTGPFITNTNGSGGYWIPSIGPTAQNANTAYFWHRYSSTIPPVASISNAKFRWAQLATSSTGFDAWGIDEVEIICPQANISVLWSTGDTVFNPSAIHLPPHPNNLPYDTSFIVTISDAGNSASDTVYVHVNPIPIVNLGADTIIGLSQTLALDAGSSFATYLWDDNSKNKIRQIIGSVVGVGIHTYFVEVSSFGCMASDTIVVEVIDDTGINDKYNSNSISLIPNPTKGIFNIVINGIKGDFELQIIDLSGRILSSEKFNSVKDIFDKQIYATNYSKGIYLIRIANKDFVKVEKLVLQ